MLASKRLRLIAGSFHRVAAATTVEILISISLLRSHYKGQCSDATRAPRWRPGLVRSSNARFRPLFNRFSAERRVADVFEQLRQAQQSQDSSDKGKPVGGALGAMLGGLGIKLRDVDSFAVKNPNGLFTNQTSRGGQYGNGENI